MSLRIFSLVAFSLYVTGCATKESATDSRRDTASIYEQELQLLVDSDSGTKEYRANTIVFRKDGKVFGYSSKNASPSDQPIWTVASESSELQVDLIRGPVSSETKQRELQEKRSPLSVSCDEREIGRSARALIYKNGVLSGYHAIAPKEAWKVSGENCLVISGYYPGGGA